MLRCVVAEDVVCSRCEVREGDVCVFVRRRSEGSAK